MTSDKKWYHYGMLPFGGMVIIVVIAIILMLIQSFTAWTVEDIDVVYDNECQVVWKADNEKVNGFVAAQCNNMFVQLTANQEALFMNNALTTGSDPAILCKKTITQYRKKVNWECKIGTEDKNDRT